MATDHNFRVKNGLEVGGVLIVNSSGQLVVADISSNQKFLDNVRLRFGNSSDLQIYHDGTHSYIDSSTGSLYIRTGNTLQFKNQSGSETLATFAVNGASTLYHDNSKKFETTASGVQIQGNIAATTAGYLPIVYGGSTGLQLKSNTSELFANFANNSSASLYWDNAKKFETLSSGIQVFSAHGNATFGSQNTTGFHIYTDRDRFYFNKQISLIDNTLTSYDDDLVLKRVGSTKLTLTSTGVSVGGDLSVSGDLNITGDINSVSVTDLDVVDKTITVGQGQTASNSTGSGLIVAGSNANMLWDNSDDRWEFNKDVFTTGAFEIGNSRIYASGDNNHLHLDVPTAIIGPSTTTASNPSIGTSAYRFNGVFSSSGSFSGDMTIAGTTLINGANDNGGKADFAVGCGGNSQISWNGTQIQAGGTDMNWSGKVLHDGTFRMAAWNSDIQFFSQSSNTGSAASRDMYWSPQISGTGVATERMRLKGDTGRLGIGTNAPAGNLHIKSFGDVGDALLIVEADNDNNIEQDNPRIELRQDGANVTGYIYLEGTGGSTATGTTDNALVLDSKGAASAQGIQFAVSGRAVAQSGGETNSTVAMTILGANRNVGIGHSTPSEKLHIHDGSIYITPVSYAANQDDWALKIGAHNNAGWDYAGVKLRVNSNGGPRMSLMGVGQFEAMSIVGQNIGISQIAPADKLHIGAGNILLDNNLELRQKDTGGNVRTIVRVNSSNQLQYGWSANAPVLFMGGGSYTERMRIHTNGNIGIGEQAPSHKLDVNGTIRAQGAITSTLTSSGGTFLSIGHSGNENWSFDAKSGSGSTDYVDFGIAGGTRCMTWQEDGNVGINEAAPDSRLHITGTDGGWDKHITIEHDGSDIGKILVDADGMKFRNMSSGNGFYFRDSSNNTDMVIDSSGQVGIGVGSNPGQKLDVAGIIRSLSSNPQVRIKSTGTQNGYLVFGDSSDDDVGWIMYDHTNERMEFRVGADVKMRIQSDDLIVLGNRILDFNTDGGVSTQPQFIGDRSTTDLNSRAFTNEGGFSYTTFEDSTSNAPSHTSNNANGLITINTHNGNYQHQLAFTNQGNIAQRNRDGGGFTSWYNLITDRTPNAPSITSTTVVNETIEIVFAASTSSGHTAATAYEVWSDGGTGDFSLIARIPYNDLASSMSVVDSSFDDSGTINYRIYAIKHGVYSTAATTSRAFSMPSLDVSSMSVVPDTNSFKIQYNLPNTRFLDHVEIYMDAEVSNSNLARSGASLIYSGKNPSYCYSISSSDMAKYHQFWVECVSV